MNSPKAMKSKAEYERVHLIKIQKQYSDTLNFQDSHIASRAMRFKDQQHTNCVELLFDAWEQYRDEHGGEEGNINSDKNDLPELPEITRQRTTDDPYTVESIILERHIYEMLYNLLLASHYQIIKRKQKLMNELFLYITAKQSKQKKKRSDIIAKYLPKNEEEMKPIIDRIFESIVEKHYWRCKVFTETNKADIIKYIKHCCCLSFEMVIANHHLSFFPLLFTDPSSSYIAPVVRYDKVIKKIEKKTKSLDESALLKIIHDNKAESAFDEGRQKLSGSAIIETKQILYYTFPGVISKYKDKVLAKACVFTYDDPSIFLRHHLNWIFSDKYFRKRKMNQFKKDKSVELEEENTVASNPFLCASNESDITDPYQHIAPKMDTMMDKIVSNNGVIKKCDFLGKAQLIQDWVALKKQSVAQLCDELCDLIMEQKGNENANEGDTEDKSDDDDDDEYEYECNEIASKLLFELMMKSREIMKSKSRSNNNANNEDNITYLNMYCLYKHFVNLNENNEIKAKVDIKHRCIVQSIVNSVFDGVIDDEKSNYSEYSFLKTDEKLNQKLREYIALCCELICNILHHEWDLCPVRLDGNKSLKRFDEKTHIKDDMLSMEESQNKIGYCCFPGIIAKSCWNQFDRQCDAKQITEKQINKVLHCKIWIVLTR